MSRMVPDPSMFPIEDRGYGRGVGHLLLPSGQCLAVQHEQDELANVLARLTFAEWEKLMGYVNPVEPPEPGESQIRAKDLKNRVVVLKPFDTGEWPAKHENGKDVPAQPYVECECWVIDGGDAPEAYESRLRVSWWRAVDQLGKQMGQYVAARIVEQDDRSVILAPLDERRAAGVNKVWDQIEVKQSAAQDAAEGFNEEPFS